ncbi:MAG: HDIG domain-containing protein [Candidatus Hydrogenedentes bacterium]|nr:HDIG domain-containing protein [Candidatus Hydrogenedentota bacterium]
MLTRFRKRQPLSPGMYRGQQQEDDEAKQRRWLRIILLVSFAFLVIVITKRLDLGRQTQAINTDGKVAQETVVAEIGFSSEDIDRTRDAREAAAAKVPDAFRIDDARVQQQLAAFDELTTRIDALKPAVEAALEELRAQSGADEPSATAVSKVLRIVAEAAIEDDSALATLTPEMLATWLAPRAAPETKAVAPVESEEVVAEETPTPAPAFSFAHLGDLVRLARSSLEFTLAQGIIGPGDRSSEIFSKDPDRIILVTRDKPVAGQYSEEELAFNDILTVETAQGALRSRIAKVADELPESAATIDRIRLQDAAYDVSRQFIAETLAYDADMTNVMRDEARLAVAPVTKEIMAQEEIQRKGQRWTPQSRMDAKTYTEMKARFDQQTANLTGTIVAHMIIVGLALFALVRALPWLHRDAEHRFQVLCLALLVVCVTVFIGRVVTYFTDVGLVVPAAAGAILIAILANARVASLTSIIAALLLSVEFDYSWQLLVITGAMSFTGVMSIYRVRKRSDMGNASVKATLVGVLIVLALALTQDSLLANSTLYALMMVGVNGVFCLGLVPAVLPTLERLFGITTDIQLLEYSDLNNPVLSRLAMEVPATYAHSLMIGQLAEAAADAIGANGLMARVCAYYHDIGKMKRPEYFVENQTGVNIHDELSPRLSARAIASHVSEGAEMARELHLPKPIIDGILEHHGTCLISFFYKEAVAQAKHGGVSEADFRYPGPRPRHRETAILMICDAVESAVRTLKNPNEERVREMVDRIIASRASDRQFDECDLTLKDLDTIAEVVSKRVTSTQHRRIAYPDQKPETKATNVIPLTGGQD